MPFYLNRIFRSETFVDEQLYYRVRATGPYLLVFKVSCQWNWSPNSFTAERNKNGSSKLVTTGKPIEPSKASAEVHLSVKIKALLDEPEHRLDGLEF